MALEAETETHALPVVGVQPRDSAQWRNDILIGMALSAVVFVLYVLPSALWRPLIETEEARVGVVAREMIQSHDYVLPTINGEERVSEPPLPIWLTAFAARMIGGSDLSERVMTRAVEIPSAVVASMAVFLAVLYAGSIAGRAAGVLSGLILGLSVSAMHYAQLGYGDMLLMACCTAMFCSAAWLLCVPHAGAVAAFAFGISLGLAVLTKGHVPILFLGAPLLVEVIIRHSFNVRKVLLFTMGLIVTACVAAPWFYLVDSQHPGALEGMSAHAKEVLTVSNGKHVGYYVLALAAGLMPWSPVLLFAWPFYLLKKRTPEEIAANPRPLINEHLRFFALAAVCGLIGLSAIAGKQAHYFLPLLPAIALGSGIMLSRMKYSGGIAEERLAWSQLYIGFAGALAIAAIPFIAPSFAGHTDHLSVAITATDAVLHWALIPIGLALAAVAFYCARQWVEGKIVHAGGLLAGAAYAAMIGWSVYWTIQVQNDFQLAKESARLREDSAKIAATVPMFAVSKESSALLSFYLERSVRTLKSAAGQTAADIPQRALIADRERLKALELTALLPAAEDQSYVVVPAVEEADWQKISETTAGAVKNERKE